MFYIHGGAFFEGHANANLHGPEYLLDKDIVLVTANYRLGTYQFNYLHYEFITNITV